MNLMAQFDFGNDSVSFAKSSTKTYSKIERLFITSRAMWVNELKNRWHSTELPAPLCDIVYGKEGEFRMGLPSGEYRICLFFYDPIAEWKPFKVSIQATTPYAKRFCGKQICDGVINTQKGQPTEWSVEVKHDGGVLAVSFPGIEGEENGFFVSGLKLYSKDKVDFIPMYTEAPSDVLPTVKEVLDTGSDDKKAALKKLCDWICNSRRPDGFVGDMEEGMRLWYTASYPVRTLLAGYQLFKEQLYFDVSIKLIDLFVSEQMPEGGFTQAYRAMPTKEATQEELEQARQDNWMNLADVGSMVAALAIATKYVEGERKERYLNAVRHYLDDWALRYRQENGGFTNGWIRRIASKVYSVSTSNTALSLSMFYKLTGEEKYLSLAQDAVRLLLKDWSKDGPNWNFIFDGTFPGHDHYQGVNEFGDGFYTMESLMALLEISNDNGFKKEIIDGLRCYLYGEKGLFAYMGENSWWPLQNNWHNSKSAGNPILLQDLLRFGEKYGATKDELEAARKALDITTKFLCTPKFSSMLGVALGDPTNDYPFGVHSIQSWTGCAAAATGFAGIALANLTCPGIIFLAEEE